MLKSLRLTTTVFVALFAVASMASELTGNTVFQPTYRLSWTAQQFPTVFIDANIEVEDGRLAMFHGLGWTLGEERGFAAYVNGISVRDSDGRALEVVADDSTGWTLPGFHDGQVTLSYQ